LNDNQLTGTIPSTVRQLIAWYDYFFFAHESPASQLRLQ
jgi:hypothetical protein